MASPTKPLVGGHRANVSSGPSTPVARTPTSADAPDPSIASGRPRAHAFYLTPEAKTRIMAQEFAIDSRGDYTVDRIFLDYLHPAHNVGWKLHVVKPPTFGVAHRAAALTQGRPTLPKNYRDLLRYLYVKKIPHKIVRNLAGLEAMEKNATQVGKFITIYPSGTEQLKRVPEIIEALIPDNPPGNRNAPGDLPVGGRGLASARWGGLTSAYTVNSDNKIVEDQRISARPNWVKNPFDHASNGAEGWVKFNQDQRIDIRYLERAKNAKGGYGLL